MKAKRPARGAASGKKSRSNTGGRSVREARRTVDPPPRRRNQMRDARPQRSVPQSSPTRRRQPDGPARPKSASQAKARAKARKAKAPKVVRTPLRQRIVLRLAAVDLNPRTLIARVPFVVLVIAALGTGLGVTLWLSTDAAERSYQLGNARQVNQALIQQKEALERDVLEAQAAPALAEAARELGMIPSRETAHLVQDAAGNWVVVGTPKPAEGAPPPPLNAPLPDPAPPAPRVVAPLEVPVLVPPAAGQLAAPGLAPGSALIEPGLPAVPGAPGMSVAPGATAVPGTAGISGLPGVAGMPAAPGAAAVPLTGGPGVAVPHAMPGAAPTPGPGPLIAPGSAGVGTTPPGSQFGSPTSVDGPQLLPEVATQPGQQLSTEQSTPVPGAPA